MRKEDLNTYVFMNKQKSQKKQIKHTNSNELKNLINQYYSELSLNFTDKSKKIAYVSSMAPVEILKAMDFELYFPENHAAVIGAKRLTDNYYSEALNKLNYSENCCSYLLSDIGADICESSPLKNYNLPPKPDVIIYNTNQCLDIKNWFNYYAEKYKVPIYGIETPHTLQNVDNTTVAYISSQLKQLIDNLETEFNKKLDYAKLEEVVKNSSECSKLWKEVHGFTRQSPAPLTFFDLCTLMTPAVLMRGDIRANQFYKDLIDELKNKTKNNISDIKDEKYRLLWCGLPIWGSLRSLSNLFITNNASVVNSVYTSSWIFDFSTENILDSIAESYTKLFINLSEDKKYETLSKLIEEWHVQGVIFHHSLSCKRNSDNYYGLSKLLKDKLGIPSITFEADHNNLRDFNRKRFTILTEALLDQIDINR